MNVVGPLHIAIDGPVASGKGEIASRLAKKFGLIYLYTGAMYRALALACKEHGVRSRDQARVSALLGQITIQMGPPVRNSSYPYAVYLDGKDVTERIFHQDIAQGASDVGVIPFVRTWMVKKQQEMARGKRIVMEGRDIALRVLPEAQLKIYLTASLEERAKRRHAQLQEKGVNTSLDAIIADTRIRDDQDMSRTVDPLQKVPDAWELDTTGLSPDAAVERISKELQKRGSI